MQEQAPEPVAESTPKLSTASLTHEWSAFDPKSGGYHWGTGRRKTSIARVRIKRGTGVFKINDKDIEQFLRLENDRRAVTRPLEATDTRKRVDVFVNVTGGGTTGQSGAIVLGVARALLKANKEYQPFLREGGFLTRDPREVERKKYGRAGARRSFQFSKR
jgi:small subunit ribosomal protein S9